jgi:hypothetical protein
MNRNNTLLTENLEISLSDAYNESMLDDSSLLEDRQSPSMIFKQHMTTNQNIINQNNVEIEHNQNILTTVEELRSLSSLILSTSEGLPLIVLFALLKLF